MHSCDLQQLLWPPAPAQGWHLRLCLGPSCCSGILNLLHRGGNSWPEILIMRMFLTSNSMSLNEIGLSRLSASSVFHLVSSLWPSCLFSSEFSIVHSRSFLRTLLPLSDLSGLCIQASLSFRILLIVFPLTFLTRVGLCALPRTITFLFHSFLYHFCRLNLVLFFGRKRPIKQFYFPRQTLNSDV